MSDSENNDKMDYQGFYKKYLQFMSNPDGQEMFRQAITRCQTEIAEIIGVPESHVVIKAAVVPVDMTTVKVNVNVNGVPVTDVVKNIPTESVDKPLKINFLDHDHKDLGGNIRRSMPW